MNLMGFFVRSAVREDFSQICKLFDELDEFHRRARPDIFRKPPGLPREFAYIDSLIARSDAAIIVAEDSAFGYLVGLAIALIRDVPESGVRRARKFVEIENVGVARHARRQGVGRGLVNRAFQWAAEQGLDTVELAVHDFNAGAIAFYEALGFRTMVRRLGTRIAG